jgi:alkylhydroperoxidase family enzyme
MLKHFEPILGTVMALEVMLRAVEQAGSDDCGADHLRLRGLDAIAELAAVSPK